VLRTHLCDDSPRAQKGWAVRPPVLGLEVRGRRLVAAPDSGDALRLADPVDVGWECVPAPRYNEAYQFSEMYGILSQVIRIPVKILMTWRWYVYGVDLGGSRP
jgi:hypothetical protein